MSKSKDEIVGYSIQVKKLLYIMKEELPYTTKELLKLLDLKTRVSFKKNYLDSALNLVIVSMILPDTPKSRNQRYIRK